MNTDRAGISIVIPTLNEAEALPETVRHARALAELEEIIVVDGGSRDGTGELARQLGCRVIEGSGGRGGQLRMGAAEARGDVVLLLHADTWLPSNAGQAAFVGLQRPSVVGGGFWKAFRDAPWFMRGARVRSALYFRLTGCILGDQGFFVRRRVLEQVGGVPDVTLMEEFELCRRLRRVGRLVLADATVRTSARRFRTQGVLRTYWRMGQVTALYLMGCSPERLRRRYEHGGR